MQITVEGQVQGDLSGDQKVVIKASSNVVGNVNAPRVSLEDGAKFKGMIDMSSTQPASSKDAKS